MACSGFFPHVLSGREGGQGVGGEERREGQ